MWRKRHSDMVHPVLLKLLQIEQRPWCMTGPPFLPPPLITGKMTEGADDTCFKSMGAGQAVDNRREKAEALVLFRFGSVWLAVDKVKLVVAC